MLRPALIVLTALVGMFVHPFDPGIWDFIFKLLLFGVISFLVFEKYIKKEVPAITTDKPEATVRSLKKDTVGNPAHSELNSLLVSDDRAKDYLLKQFEIMQGILIPDNGWVLYGQDAKDLDIIHCDGAEAYIAVEKIDTIQLNGLLQIVHERDGILLENNVAGAAQILRWYRESEYRVASFIGFSIPVTEKEKIFITFDAKVAGHFNREDLKLLEAIRDGIALTLKTRLRAVDLVNVVKDQQELLQFAQHLNRSKTAPEAITVFTNKISESFEASRLTLSMIKGNGIAVIKRAVGIQDSFPENHEFDLDDGLHGWVMSKEKAYVIDDLEKGEYFIPRFNRDEKSTYGLRSFLGIPLQSNGKTLGAIVLEHTEIKKYGDSEKSRLAAFVKIYTSTLQRYTHE